MDTSLKRRPVCGEPKMFAQAPEVCDNCGNLIVAHRHSGTSPAVLEAMWKIMIRFGGIHGQFGGGVDQYGGNVVREHMASCAVDFTCTEEPTMDGLFTCNDSFADPEPVTMLNGDLYCRCGKYRGQTICIDDMTVGQLIWEITHLDDEQPAGEQQR